MNQLEKTRFEWSRDQCIYLTPRASANNLFSFISRRAWTSFSKSLSFVSRKRISKSLAALVTPIRLLSSSAPWTTWSAILRRVPSNARLCGVMIRSDTSKIIFIVRAGPEMAIWELLDPFLFPKAFPELRAEQWGAGLSLKNNRKENISRFWQGPVHTGRVARSEAN